jgi:uncharacterized membrane protein YfcA
VARSPRWPAGRAAAGRRELEWGGRAGIVVLYNLGIIAVGLGVGIFGATFGLGGGLIMVPVLLYVYRKDIHVATATSLAVIGPLALTGTVGNAFSGKIVWVAFGFISAGSVAGAMIGATFSSRVSKATLRRLTGVSVLLIGISIVVIEAPATVESAVVVHTDIVSLGAMLLTGLGVGIFAGLLGLGGGVILNPALLFGFGFTAQQTVATSLAIIVPTSLSGATKQFMHGHLDVKMFALLAVGACSGSLLGVTFKNSIGNDDLKTLLGVVVALIALTMVFKRGAGEQAHEPDPVPATPVEP